MRRIFSAAAALVLAFGATLLGATMAGADDPAYGIQTTNLHPGDTFTFGGTLEASDYLENLTYLLPGDATVHTLDIDLNSVCPEATASNADGARSYTCSIALPSDFVAGNTYTLTAHVLEESENPSDPETAINDSFTVTPFATFTSDGMPADAYSGQAITLSGTLPEHDAITTFHVTDAGSPSPGIEAPGSGDSCFTGKSNADRTWTCDITIPTGLTDGHLYDLVTNFDNGDPATTTSTFTYHDIPSPLLDITSDTSGTTVTGTWVGTSAGQPNNGELVVTASPFDGGEAGNDGTCEFLPYNPLTCTATPIQPGLHVATLRQDFANPETSQFANNIYFTIPSMPEVHDGSYDSTTGHVTISGYGTTGDGIQVVDDQGANTCTATPDDEGAWSCTSSTPFTGLHDFYAYQVDTQTGDDVEGLPEGAIYQSGTYSASSAGNEGDQSVQLWDGLTLPSMKYTFIPGGVVSVATPTGSATKARTEFYSWTPGGVNACGQTNDGGDSENGYVVCDTCPTGSDEGEGGDFENSPLGTNTCTFENLAPGVWNPYSEQNTVFPNDYEGEGSGWVDDYFVVPTSPALTKAVNDRNGKATISGTGIPTDVVHVVADGTSDQVCQAIVASNGTWSCTTGVMPAVSTTFRAYQEDLGAGRSSGAESDDSNVSYVTGGLSAVTVDGLAVVITGGSATTTTKTPPPWTFNLSGIDLGNIHPGDTFTITATGLPAGATITTVLHSTPVTLGTATVASDGTLSQTVTIPADIPTGAHEIIVTMDGAGLTTTSATQAVTIVPTASSAGGTVITTDPSKAADSNVKTAHIGEVNPGDPTAPNILTRSINTIQDVVAHPGKISAAVAIGLVLLVFATIPARLLNATVAEQYENIVKRIPRLGRRPRWWERFTAWLKGAPGVGAVLLIVVTALLFGFADPHFGFNLASLRLIMGLGIALIIVEYLANLVTGAILKRRLGLGAILNVRPLGIILTVLGVVASRLLDFSPGFLIGLVLGLSLSGRKAAESAWKAVLIRSGVVVGLGIVAWLGYSALTTGEEKTETFWTELFVEVLVAVTTEGIVAILVELLPFRLLEGERLWHKNRFLWAGAYLFVLVAFIVAVVPWEGNWEALGSSLWIWITAVAVFFALCVGLYLYFRFASPFRETAEEHEEDPVEVGGGG